MNGSISQFSSNQRLARLQFGIAGLCLWLGGLAGCTPSASRPLDSHSTATRAGKYSLSYVSSPDPIRVAQPFSMTIKVAERGKTDAPVTDAHLSVDGWMPDHQHGMYTTPTVTSNGDGTYTVQGMLFHMEMHWQIRVNVSRAEATDQAVFNVMCCAQ